MADRTFLNALEQQVRVESPAPQTVASHSEKPEKLTRARGCQVAFLLPLWLHAVFISPSVSAYMGAIGVVARAAFPLLWATKGQWNMLVELSTQPYYLVVFYFLGALLTLAVSGVNVAVDWPGWSL
jgi:hypothetical protein